MDGRAVSLPAEPLSSGPRSGPARILVVDDDPTVSEVLSRYLQHAGHTVEAVNDGPTALDTAIRSCPDLIVLDLMLPGLDGIEVFRRVRDRLAVPVVMLTARGDEEDRILGLAVGADDYVTKPFSPREVVLRVESILRRTRAGQSVPGVQGSLMEFGTLSVNTASRSVSVGDRQVDLTAREFDLLAYLCTHAGRAFRREELLEEVWGWSFGDTATVTVHIRRLREKIEVDPSEPRRIATVWGVGYRFDP